MKAQIRNAVRDMRFCSLCLAAVILAAAIAIPLKAAVDQESPESSAEMFAIYSPTQVAYMLCVPGDFFFVRDLYFKGPSGIRIKARWENSGQFPGSVFSWLCSDGIHAWRIRRFSSFCFRKDTKTYPLIYDLNGEFICALIEKGNSASIGDWKLQVAAGFSRLPQFLQDGLREFFMFCAGPRTDTEEQQLSGAVNFATGLPFMGQRPEPYQVTYRQINDPEQIKAFRAEFDDVR